MSKIRIRQADIHADRDCLVESLREHLTALSTERRFRWFYEENPDGYAQAWIAEDTESGRTIGSGAIIPRRVHVADTEQQVAVMADFWIHPNFRSLGPAVKLQRACIEAANTKAFAFYDLPQGQMPAVYRRLRILGEKQLLTLVKPLRADPYVRRITSVVGLVSVLSLGANLWLRFCDWLRRRRSDCAVSRHIGEIGPEFSELARNARNDAEICVVRSAEYLNWRYLRHYHLSYEVYTARREGRLVAYAVVYDTGTYADIIDLFGFFEPDIIRELVLEIATIFRARGRAALSLPLHAPDRWVDVVQRLGFSERGRRPLVIQESDGAGSASEQRADAAWFLCYGEIDY